MHYFFLAEYPDLLKLEGAVRQMADGDLSVSITSRGTDEVAQLAKSTREMQANLLLYVSEIRRCLSALANGDLTVAVEAEFRAISMKYVIPLKQLLTPK